MSDTLPRARRGSHHRRARPVHAHRQPRWPRHVRIADIEPRDYFQRRSSLTSVPHMCVTGARGALQPTRALMMSDTLSRRTSSSLRFEPIAVRARASTAPDNRCAHPHSPCGLLECCGSPHSESTCWTRSFFASEHLEPFYYSIDPKTDRKRRHYHLVAARRSLCRRHLARRSSSERVHVHAQRGQPWP